MAIAIPRHSVGPPMSVILPPDEEKTYFTVKHLPSNREVQIKFDPNDTISILKEKIWSSFQFDFDIKYLQLKIDSELIDTSSTPSTLLSTGISSSSTILVSEKKQIKRPTKGHGHYGLRNLGNTCYMNSALQCLSHVEPLTDYFLTCDKLSGDVSRAYGNFIRNIWIHNRPYNPGSIKRCISQHAPEFGSYDQQDAHEFMILLLNQLHQELVEEGEPTSIISKLFMCQLASITTCLTCKGIRKTCNSSYFIPLSLSEEKKRRTFEINLNSFHLSVETNSNGFIEDLVQAFLNELRQKENYSIDGLREHLKVLSSSTNEELSFRTSLNDVLDKELKMIEDEQVLREPRAETNHQNKSLNLLDCFNEFIAIETPNNLWTCEIECQKSVYCAKRMRLATLPPVLLIQLKRFIEEKGCLRKINTFVDFPLDGLDLSKFTIGEQENALYDLIAVVNHSGNLNRDHYITYARQLNSKSKQWFCFDDDHVTPIIETDAVSHGAYILAYVKREKPEIPF